MASQKQGDPEYLLAETGNELERLRKQHAWIQTCVKGQIVFAPIDLKKDGLKVLDVGCADGTLLRDLQLQLSPGAQLVGADVMPSFLPKENPSGNIRYVVQDICEPFPSDLQNSFDLTLLRYVLAGGAKVGIKGEVTNLASTVKPGGWLQVTELDVVEDAPGFTPALKDLFSVMRSLFVKLGMGYNFARELDVAFKEAGLEHVTVKKVELPVGKKMGNEKDARNSVEPFKITIPSLIGGCKALGAEVPEKMTENLKERFEKEMMEQGGLIHEIIVTGQKRSA